MTNGQLRGSLLTMQVALNSVQSQVFSGDDTPNNLDNRQWWDAASSAISIAQDQIPSGMDAPSQESITRFNMANVAYKTFTSTWSEFGNTVFPSFADALIESVEQLPETVGSSIGAVVNGAGNAAKNLVGSFFGSLGIWGWFLMIGVGLAILTYIYPQWTLAVRGIFYK